MNYSNTAQGAIDYVKNETVFNNEVDETIKTYRAFPDPEVDFVWLVRIERHNPHKDEACIVYLDQNDFETVD